MVTRDCDVTAVLFCEGHRIVNAGVVKQSVVAHSASSGWLHDVTVIRSTTTTVWLCMRNMANEFSCCRVV